MTNSAQDAPVATIDGVPTLVGARCTTCETHTFPRQDACPRCGAATVTQALPTMGSVWSWTVQRFEPKAPYRGPVGFEPFAVAYVDLGPVRVESTLGGRAVEDWNIDDGVRLVADDIDESGHSWRYHFEKSAS